MPWLGTRPIINRAPNTMDEFHPCSVDVVDGRAQRLQPNSETPTRWTPYGFQAVQPYQGGWDPKSQAGRGLMQHAVADMYDPTANPWPNNGQYDRPNGFWAGLLRLQPTGSAHPGKAMPTAPSPTMFFHAPPPNSVQTQPIAAVGI